MSISKSSSTGSLLVEKRPSVTADLNLRPSVETTQNSNAKAYNDNDNNNETEIETETDAFMSAASSATSPTASVSATTAAAVAVAVAVAGTNSSLPPPPPPTSQSKAQSPEAPETDTGSSAPQDKLNKTLAEITQDLKGKMSLTLAEIDRSDAEFERLIGNLEKKIESLRVQLSS